MVKHGGVNVKQVWQSSSHTDNGYAVTDANFDVLVCAVKGHKQWESRWCILQTIQAEYKRSERAKIIATTLYQKDIDGGAL